MISSALFMRIPTGTAPGIGIGSCMLVGTSGFTGYALWQNVFGRTVTTTIDGKKISYHIQPISPGQLEGRMFNPVRDKPKLNFASFRNNLKYVPQRAPITAAMFVISTFATLYTVPPALYATYTSNQSFNQ